jgi:hypothetical protein
MKQFIFLAVAASLLLTNCSKKLTPVPEKPESKITVKKNSINWQNDGIYASYNSDEDIIYVVTEKDNERFAISFKKGAIPVDGIMKDFSADVLASPFKGSAAISDSYQLDTSKPNKLKILIIENPEKRIVADFTLHLKRNEKYSTTEEINVFQGRFDIRYEPFTLK